MTKRENRFLIVILIVSVLARLAAAFFLGNEVVDMPGTADQVSYHNLALRILDGYGFTYGEDWWPATKAGAPTAHWSYLYTGYLVAVYSLFGPNPLLARLIQALIVGVLHPLLAFLIGRKVFGKLIGLAAAAITAFYVYFIYYAGALMTEPFYITAILASLYLAMLAVELPQDGENAGKYRLALGLGLALGVTVLLRQLFLLVIPFIFLWILLAGLRQIRILVPAGLVVLALILPFTVFNYARFERFVLLNTNAGFAFFWGNHPIYGTNFEPILPAAMGTYQDLIPRELLSLDEAALDQALLRRGLQFVVDDPGRYLLLSLSRIPAYFMFWPSPDSSNISNLSRVASFGILWPFMLYGLIHAFSKKFSLADLRTPSPLTLLGLFCLLYTVIHVLSWTLIRYRLPVDAVLVVFAAFGLMDLASRVPKLRQFTEEPVEIGSD